jgi:hypothetical protein
MKTQGALALIGTLFISVFFGACSFPLDEPQEQTAPGLVAREGHGLVKISLTLGDARTALPEIGVFASYRLQFIRAGETEAVLSETTPDTALTIELEAGTYTLVVTGYNSDDELLAQGSAEVVVSENLETPVTVQLNATQTGSGTLRYTISVPEALGLETGILRLDPLPEGGTLELDLSSGWEGTEVIASGFYRARCYLQGTMDTVAGNKSGGKTMVVHIYDNVETKLEFTFEDDEFINDSLSRWLVGDGTELLAALTAIESSAETNIDIEVNSNFSLDPVTLSGTGYRGKTITVHGTGTASHEISLNSNGALFTVGSDVTLAVENITLKGKTDNDRAVLHVDGGTLVLNTGAAISGNSNFSSSSSRSDGGGVYVGNNGTFTMQDNAVIQGNTASVSYSSASAYASSYGGGVSVDNNGTFPMHDNAEIQGITATAYSPASSSRSDGGGVYVGNNGTFTMQDNAVIQGNTASASSAAYASNVYSLSYGGGVYVDNNGTFTMQDNAVIQGNTASAAPSAYSAYSSAVSDGGGVYVGGINGTFTMQDNAVIQGNTASAAGYSFGGGVLNYGTFTMQGSAVIQDNTAYFSAGGVYNYGTFTMQGSAVIQGNTTSFSAGGVYNRGTFTMRDNAVIQGNTASGFASGVGGDAGGVYNQRTFTMQGSAVIQDNTASGDGGGVFVDNYSTFNMHDSAVIRGNTASGNGGGVYVGWDSSISGTFRKEPKEAGGTSGIIYGSDESGVDENGSNLKNTAASGSAVYGYNNAIDTTVGETTSLCISSENGD